MGEIDGKLVLVLPSILDTDGLVDDSDTFELLKRTSDRTPVEP